MKHTMKKLTVIIMLLVISLAAPCVVAEPVDDMGDRYEAPELEGTFPVAGNLIAVGTLIGIALVAAKKPRREHMGQAD